MLTNRHRKQSQAGFNLIELMVVLFVGSILLGIGLPSMSNFMATNRMASAANDVSTSIHMARTEAVKRQANISICPSANWSAATPACDMTADIRDGWIIFVDSAPPTVPNLSVDGADVLYAHGPIADDIDLTVADTANVIAGQQFIAFASTGYPFPAVGGNNGTLNIQLCDQRGDLNTGGGIAAGRWIQMTRTGRPQIHREQNIVQADANPVGGC